MIRNPVWGILGADEEADDWLASALEPPELDVDDDTSGVLTEKDPMEGRSAAKGETSIGLKAELAWLKSCTSFFVGARV